MIKKAALTVKVGKTVTVGLKNTKYKAKDIEWKTSNSSIAAVEPGGKIRGKKPGTVEIYTDKGGVRNICTVTVK